MSAPPGRSGPTLTRKRQLVEYLEAACKPREAWRAGTEHEKFVFELDSLRSPPYEGPRGIRAFLEALGRFGWEPVYEGGTPIALSRDGCAISLEPGGQLELAGEPLDAIHQSCQEVHEHLRQVKEVARELGLGLIGLGFHPKWTREQMPWMPKSRYRIMRRYMPRRGGHGLDMMLRSCTVQVNLDYGSERDMVAKLRVGLALQPIATALFANSPFAAGRPTGYLSYRSLVWTDTDPDRCGMLSFAFEDGMGFERYADWALDVPMYFVYRDGRYVDASGQSFKDFLAGRLPALRGEYPTAGDWENHLTTLFPEVRLKRFLEMRGADGGPWSRLCALPAFWVGLLYDEDCLEAAWSVVKGWTADDRERLRNEVPRLALAARIGGRSVREVALEVLAICRRGLARRARLDAAGRDECHFTDTLLEIAESGRTPAERLIEAYQGRWGGSVDPVFREHAY